MLRKFTLSFLFFVIPNFAFATTTVADVMATIKGIIDSLVPVAIILAMLFFIWGLAIFIKDSGNEEKVTEGKQKMIWGIIAIFVIVSVWGLVWLVARSLGILPGTRALVPCLPPFENCASAPVGGPDLDGGAGGTGGVGGAGAGGGDGSDGWGDGTGPFFFRRI